jgi:3-demethoxyubiquinol 3-hydroxylase
MTVIARPLWRSTARLTAGRRTGACCSGLHSNRRPLSTTSAAAANPLNAAPEPSSHARTPTPATEASPGERGNAGPGRKLKPLTPEQRAYLASALRVNQAGELAAKLIYTAQIPHIVRREPHLRPLMKHMYDQEVGHFETFNALIAKHRVRPTAMWPVWQVMAYGLGWTTAALGRPAAMACTEAVETEIGNHYNSQIRSLLEMVSGWEAEGYDVGDEFRTLIKTLRRIRDEELEHLDHAVEHDAKMAEPHWLLTGIIRAGCRGAIWVSEKV